MESFDIAKWKKSFLTENIQEKYQVVFHDYSGDDILYTGKLFNTEMEAENFVQDYESDEEVEVYKDGDYRYETRYRYYNPEDKESYFGYHIEKVTV
jgi:hypothetical protein